MTCFLLRIITLKNAKIKTNFNFYLENFLKMIKFFLLLYLTKLIKNTSPKCENIDLESRFNCMPEGSNQIECERRECCWSNETVSEAPNCFYPQNFPNYRVVSSTVNVNELKYSLIKDRKTHRPSEISNLEVRISFESKTALRVRIIDPNNRRYEVPFLKTVKPRLENDTDYQIFVNEDPFAIKIFRKSTGKIIFDTDVAPLIYADQYIEFSTSLTNNYFYGFGEHRDNLAHETNWSRYTFWNRDTSPSLNTNLYGTHPFYMTVDKNGQAMGFYFQNSNAMEALVTPKPAITFITTGGIVDFYIYIGPAPSDVVFQHTLVVGPSQMPQYFTLGFHLCRWGYSSSENLRQVIKRNRMIGIPYDVQWTDIDAMHDKLDWTYDTNNFSSLPEIVQDLHQNGMYYINIIDPGIHNLSGYIPFDSGIENKIFVRYFNESEPLIGSVWPGWTVYPDFTNPNATKWWTQLASYFFDQIPFDGLWIDMNEPSNFVDGSIKGCTGNKFDEPPYLPKVLGQKLYSKTICPSSEHYLSNHYNLHNMYGHFEAAISYSALLNIKKNKRPFVLTRSSFSGTGRFAAHWTGDNSATWKDLYYSIPAILSFNMFGISQVGADVCGFNGNTTEELCIRWMQLGAFYPFMRNHNSINSKDQDPAVFSKSAQEIMKKALYTRYALLPYLYGLFFISSQIGETIVRPLFFEYPQDIKTHKIDKQFMFGEAILVTPVLDQGAKTVKAYFPNDTWYNYRSGYRLDLSQSQYLDLDVSLDDIPIHVRGGRIIPYQHPDVNTKLSRKNTFGLIVALRNNWDDEKNAVGYLYWDDGESLNSLNENIFNYFMFFAGKKLLKINRYYFKYKTKMFLSDLRILGVDEPVKEVNLDGVSYDNFIYDSNSKVLKIESLSIDLLSKNIFNVMWH